MDAMTWAPGITHFPPDCRASGLLLHVTSLPSRCGMLSAWNFRWLRELTSVTRRSGFVQAPLMVAAS